jgi:hypothetical protein
VQAINTVQSQQATPAHQHSVQAINTVQSQQATAAHLQSVQASAEFYINKLKATALPLKPSHYALLL